MKLNILGNENTHQKNKKLEDILQYILKHVKKTKAVTIKFFSYLKPSTHDSKKLK